MAPTKIHISAILRHLTETLHTLLQDACVDSASSHLTPLLHTALLRRVSMRTSGVPISFTANLRISLMARGALFLKPLQGGDEAVNDTEGNPSNANNHFAIHPTIFNTCGLSCMHTKVYTTLLSRTQAAVKHPTLDDTNYASSTASHTLKSLSNTIKYPHMTGMKDERGNNGTILD